MKKKLSFLLSMLIVFNAFSMGVSTVNAKEEENNVEIENSIENNKNSEKNALVVNTVIGDDSNNESSSFTKNNFVSKDEGYTGLAENFSNEKKSENKSVVEKRKLSDSELQNLKQLIGIKNANMVSYRFNGKNLNVVWTYGITPPNAEDFVKYDDTIVTRMINGSNWYDLNKRRDTDIKHKNLYDKIFGGDNNVQPSDSVLCSGAVAANQLHWWLEVNKDYVQRYINESPDNGVLSFKGIKFEDIRNLINSYKSQTDSRIFRMFIEFFGGRKNGIFSDTTIDMFINGYTPNGYKTNHNRALTKKDNRGGFFKPVFESNILTNRINIYNNKNHFKNVLVENLEKGNSMGLVHVAVKNRYNHIINIWGAEFDDKGELTGIYITDSDDKYSNIERDVQRALVRYNVNYSEGKLKVSTVPNESYGAEVVSIYTLSQGRDKWEEYFNKKDNSSDLEKKKKKEPKKKRSLMQINGLKKMVKFIELIKMVI